MLTWEYADHPLRKTGREAHGVDRPWEPGDAVAGLGAPCIWLDTHAAGGSHQFVRETSDTVLVTVVPLPQCPVTSWTPCRETQWTPPSEVTTWIKRNA